jgi:hypothetical protein
MSIRHVDPGCANLACGNKVGEGRFAILEPPFSVVGARPFRILLCAPCAEVLHRHLEG